MSSVELMRSNQVALQLYTLRDHLRTPREIAGTLKRVRAIGYETVQASGLGPIERSELRAICEAEGLHLCGTHEPSDEILDNPGKVAENLHALACTATAYPAPAGFDLNDPASVTSMIRKLGAAGKALREAGCRLSYHNHATEFIRHGNQTVLDRIYSETDPADLAAELDTYWIQYGGGDPVAWCRKMSRRLPWLHLKDYAIGSNRTPTFAEVGSGNLDWRAILDAATASGCEWFIVEQDVCSGDPFVSVQKSLEFLKSNFCR